MRQSLAQSLRLDGYLVLEAGNEEEAHRTVIKHSRPIHILLADVSIHGFNLPRKLNPYRPEMHTVFYTGDTNSALAQVWKIVKPPARGLLSARPAPKS
jgi:response regulator RpfG family c-di-GMP phosphodiesterase